MLPRYLFPTGLKCYLRDGLLYLSYKNNIKGKHIVGYLTYHHIISLSIIVVMVFLQIQGMYINGTKIGSVAK